MDHDPQQPERGPQGGSGDQPQRDDSDSKWEDQGYCENLIRVAGDVFSEAQCELANVVVAQPAVANQLRQLNRASEQDQAKMIEDFFRQIVAFMPLACHLRINIGTTILSIFAQECNHPVLLEEIEKQNLDALGD